MSFSEADFKQSKASGIVFARDVPYCWRDVKDTKIPFKSSPFQGQSLEHIVMAGGREGAQHLRRLSRWADEFIDADLRDKVRVAIKYRAAYEKWLKKEEEALPTAEQFWREQAAKKPAKKSRAKKKRKQAPEPDDMDCSDGMCTIKK